jgi:hypothetical protein
LREPTYYFNVSDRVTWGNWEWVSILEVLENGKMYKVFRVTPEIEYGKIIGPKYNIGYVIWTRIRKYRTTEELDKNQSLIEDNDIRFSYMRRQISSILHSIYGGSGLDLNPDYQREHVWSEEQKVDLIDSIFKNIEIGKFTIIRRKFSEELDNYYEVLDGKQRIQAILDFYECRFKYKGLTYNDLNWIDRNHFTNYSVSWAETEPLTDKQKYRYFLKLNKCGVPMSKDQIEKVEKMLENNS